MTYAKPEITGLKREDNETYMLRRIYTLGRQDWIFTIQTVRPSRRIQQTNRPPIRGASLPGTPDKFLNELTCKSIRLAVRLCDHRVGASQHAPPGKLVVVLCWVSVFFILQPKRTQSTFRS